MSNERIMSDFIDAEMQTIKLMCSMGQWDGINDNDIALWLNNFIDTEGKYYAIKILINSLYYSENDMITLLKNGIENLIFGNILNKELVKNDNIYLPNSLYRAKINRLKEDTLFVPLLDKNKPQESGNQITRLLNQFVNINSTQIYFHRDLNEDIIKKYQKIIIVDDCIGSGEQLTNFWNSPELQKLKTIGTNYHIDWYYLVLIGYSETINNLKSSFKDLAIIACEYLQEKNRIFAKENDMWKDEVELKNSIAYFQKLEKERGMPMYGYNQLDFAVFLHKNIPDWSLPIFWKKNTDWQILLQRKNS